MLRLILNENSFQFSGKHYLQSHGTARGTKTAVAFASIFMAHIETTILSKTVSKPTVWKRYIDDVFTVCDMSKPDTEAFVKQTNLHHLTIKFTAEISDTETVFRHGCIQRHKIPGKIYPWCKEILKKRRASSTHIFTACHLPSVKKGFVKEKPWESYEGTPQRLRLRKVFQISKNTWLTEGTIL